MKAMQLLYCILYICCSCTKMVQQSEDFDVITIDKFENRYNSKENLETIKITSTEQVYKLGRLASETVNNRLYKYIYRNDSLYFISEISDRNKGEVKKIYYKGCSKETITIRNNTDTIEYSLYQYKDHKEEKLDYKRVICRATSEPIMDFVINDNYEVRYFYKNGHKAKTIKHDFNNSQTEETYYFSDILYKEALQRVPKSNNKQIIVCYTSNSKNDTLVEKSFIDGEVSQITKKYEDNGKKIEHTYTPDGNEILYIQYKERGMDITVISSSFMGNSIDSIYKKNGRIMRETHVSDESKQFVTYDYDLYGNLIKRVSKMKLFY